MWPAMIVMDLCKSLPEHYTAEPRVHIGKNFEVEVCTFDVQRGNQARSEPLERGFSAPPTTTTASTAWAAPEPTLTLELDPTEHYEYEVLIFD